MRGRILVTCSTPPLSYELTKASTAYLASLPPAFRPAKASRERSPAEGPLASHTQKRKTASALVGWRTGQGGPGPGGPSAGCDLPLRGFFPPYPLSKQNSLSCSKACCHRKGQDGAWTVVGGSAHPVPASRPAVPCMSFFAVGLYSWARLVVSVLAATVQEGWASK